MKTLKEIIQLLNDRGIHCNEIGQRIKHPFSAVYKVQRGDQPSLPYEIGKRIEVLEVKTRRRKWTTIK